jgi:acetyltransferase-like isoleucine patch superfamily enzyme
MLLLRHAFHQHGKGFLFDPDGFYTYKTIDVGDNVSINRNAIFMATRSHIIIGNKVMFGYNVTVIGGNHNTSVVGRYMGEVQDKMPENDQDVIFEDDIWVSSGVIILKGVRVGRGSIVAAGAVVNKDVLPYSVVGGVPAKKISMRFGDLETIISHELALYPPEKRLSREYLQGIFGSE